MGSTPLLEVMMGTGGGRRQPWGNAIEVGIASREEEPVTGPRELRGRRTNVAIY
jgi:hypothetical protein